jgi:tRNA(Ile)-lysidine synthase
MIRLLHKLPRNLTVAFSGGVDSVAILNFLSNSHNVTAAFFHHGTDNSDSAYDFVISHCEQYNIKLEVGYIDSTKPNDESWEEYWRNQRYKFLDKFEYVVTGHHLDDCIETYIWSALHGEPKVIPAIRNNVYRPFLLNNKSVFVDWCENKNLKYVQDTSNFDDKYMRNYIRNNMVKHAYHVNPGLDKVVRKLILNSVENLN